jgi:Carboxypeptidase regulatory-like domain
MNHFSKCRRFLALVFAGMLAFGAAHAQDTTSGSISGTISDSTGATVKGATVKLINTDRGATIRTLKTNAAGFYTGTSLPLGTYTVSISNSGFQSENITGIVLHVNDALTVNLKLTVGAESQTVTVTADQVQLNFQDATSQGLINSEQMNEMPLVTRNYETLLNLQPGVAFGGATDDLTRGPAGLSGASSTVSFSVNGGRNTSNSWTIDGSDNLDRGANLTLYTYPSPDAIAEFKTLRGQYSAAFGRNASGQIDVVTKSGSNQIHGSAYEYLRNDAFDANGYANDFLGTHISPYRYNVFGFSIGGPVYIPKVYDGRDKTFFFVSEEWQRIVQFLANAAAIVPQASERTGDFTQSGYKIPAGQTGAGTWTTGPVSVCTAYTTNPTTQVNSCTATGTQVTNMSPAAVAYLKDVWSKTPVPNVSYNIAHGLDPHTILSSFKNIFNNNDTMVRIDQQIGQKYRVFYRYLHDTFPQTLPQGQFTTIYIPGANTTTVINPGTQHLGKGTVTISPTLVLNAGYAFSNGNIVSTPAGFLASSQSSDFNPQLVFPNTVGVVPTVTISGMQNMNASIAYTDHGTNHQGFGDVTKVYKNHTFITGFSYNHYQKLENNTTGTQGSFSFGTGAQFICPSNPTTPCIPNTSIASAAGATEAQAFANFLTGNANSGFSQLSRDPVTDIKSSLWEGFFQDNWKATPRLTLNLGVRYSYYRQPWDANLLLSNFDPSTYSATKAPTIATTGLLCFTATCSQTGSNAGQSGTSNPNADYAGINYINGMIFNGPTGANNNQASSFGNKVGAAQKSNFAPRFGFALDVFGDGRTALRGGYGWAFDGSAVSFYETTVFNNPPAVATYSVGQTSFDSAAGGATTGLSSTPGRIQAVPLDYKTPYIQQYSLDIQQAITPSLMLDVGYFGDHGTHLLGGVAIDQPAPGAWQGKVQPTNSGSGCVDPDTNQASWLSTTCDRPLNQIRPYLGYNAVDALRTIFSSNYNALQAKVTKRFSGKTYIDANYTWSRALSNGQNDYSTFPQNIYNINADYGRAALDRTNILSVDGVYELPWYREQKGLVGRLIGGWSLSGILAVDSGLPLTVTASQATTTPYNLPSGTTSVFNGRTNSGYITDNAGLGVFGSTSAGARPNMLGNPNNGYGVKIHNKGYNSLWFYTGAFAATNPNDPINPGNEKRGVIEGPGFNRIDLGIHRNFRIYERLTFQFRMEAFNALNHTNVQTVGTSLGGGGTFGEVTAYRDARIVQFAGRFEF